MNRIIVLLFSLVIAGHANASNHLKSGNLNIGNLKSDSINAEKLKTDSLNTENLKHEIPNIKESKSESLNVNDLKSKDPNVWELKSLTYNNQLNLPAIQISFGCKGGEEYKVNYRPGSSGAWSTGPATICPNYDSVQYVIQPLVCNTNYEIKVKRKNRTKWYRVNQKTLPCYSSPNPAPDTSGTFRLKQVTTNKCIYGYQTPGTTNNNAYTWSCYQNPGMAFKIIVHPTTGKKKLQHQESKECLTVNNNTDGAKASLTACESANTFVLEPVTGNIVRLKAEDKNKCLYGLSQNGKPVHAWSCWNDPSMNFIVEPY